MNSIVAIYARENDQGIMFSPNMYGDDESPMGPEDNGDGDGPDDEPPTPPKGRPNLKVVK
jgi:stringent starvation protein B